MLIKEGHADVQTTADGVGSTMSMYSTYNRLAPLSGCGCSLLPRLLGIFLFHPAVPQYPNA